MLFTYDKNRIKFNSVKFHQYLMFFILPVTLIVLGGYYFGYKKGFAINVSDLSMEDRIMLVEELDPFTEDKLADMMSELGIKYPYIVLAQSRLETGVWKSSMFLENHNLFGMKKASLRVTTAKGSNNGHAYYDSWRESLYDYAFYKCRYLGNIKNESEYFAYLNASYAEDTTYVTKLKDIIQKEGYKDKFSKSKL